jgi:hypothetical protein
VEIAGSPLRSHINECQFAVVDGENIQDSEWNEVSWLIDEGESILLPLAIYHGAELYVKHSLATNLHKGLWRRKRPLLHFAVQPSYFHHRHELGINPFIVQMLLDNGEDPMEEYNQETAWQIALNFLKEEGCRAGGRYFKHGSRLAKMDTMLLPMLETIWALFRHCSGKLKYHGKVDAIVAVAEAAWRECPCAFDRPLPHHMRLVDMPAAAECSCHTRRQGKNHRSQVYGACGGEGSGGRSPG